MIEPCNIRTTVILVTHTAMHDYQWAPCLETAIRCTDPFQNTTCANRQLARNATFVRAMGSPHYLNLLHQSLDHMACGNLPGNGDCDETC